MRADRGTVTKLLKTAKGQIEGILKMVEQDQYCLDISHQILSCEALLKKVNREIIGSHVKSCVRSAFESGSPDEVDEKVNELVELMARMTK